MSDDIVSRLSYVLDNNDSLSRVVRILLSESKDTIIKLRSGIPLKPVSMILYCPACMYRHIDRGVFAIKPHHTHSCQNCGMSWRPAKEHTVGVHFLPGFTDHPEWSEGSNCPDPGCGGRLEILFANGTGAPYLQCATCERTPASVADAGQQPIEGR